MSQLTPEIHRLHHPQTGQRCTLTVTPDQASIDTETNGKTRRTEKRFATAAEADHYAEQQEWTRLKKGFVLHHNAAAPGEPRLHYLVGGGYTGSLALVGTPLGIYVYQHGWFNSATDQQDFLLHLDAAGHLQQTLALPTVLAWDAQYQPTWRALVLDLDHTIFAYHLDAGRFELLSAPGRSPASFVAVAAGCTAFAANDEVVVLDPERRVRLRLPFTTQLLKGSLPFAAALARSGNSLALHTKPGEIQLRNAHDGKLQRTLTGSFGLVRQIEFMNNDQFLLVLELHNNGQLHCFEVAQGTEIDLDLAGSENHPGWVQGYCFDAEQSRLVLLRGTWVEVYEVADWRLLQRFRLRHCVKTARLRFVGEDLGVRTDYGCFSLYRM
jgi:hypothetical protein